MERSELEKIIYEIGRSVRVCVCVCLSLLCTQIGGRPVESQAGPGETFLPGQQTFHWAPLRRKFLNVSFQNGAFWRTLYFWPTAGPPTSRDPG